MRSTAERMPQVPVPVKPLTRREHNQAQHAVREAAEEEFRRRGSAGLRTLNTIATRAVFAVETQLWLLFGRRSGSVTRTQRHALLWLFIDVYAWYQMEALESAEAVAE